jgi:hypothetical protein
MRQLLFTENNTMSAFWKYRKLENMQLTEWVDGKLHMEYSMNLGAFGTAKNYEDLVNMCFLLIGGVRFEFGYRVQ